jgi:hypothetical protein
MMKIAKIELNLDIAKLNESYKRNIYTIKLHISTKLYWKPSEVVLIAFEILKNLSILILSLAIQQF